MTLAAALPTVSPLRPATVMAIDPGPEQSAYLIYDPDGRTVHSFDILPNRELLELLRLGRTRYDCDVVAIEQVESFGMAVGREVFDTVFWSGRFAEAADSSWDPRPTVLPVTRRRVKLAICQDTRAKDANIRQALIDRFGGPSSIRKGGPLYGVSKDVWSALAIAVTVAEDRAASQPPSEDRP
jgi:hypothetical protein